jgi:hypothetical protein
MRWPALTVALDLVVSFIEFQPLVGRSAAAGREEPWPRPEDLSSQENAVMAAVCLRLWHQTPPASAARRKELEERAAAYWSARSSTPDHGELLDIDADDLVVPLIGDTLYGPDDGCHLCGCTDEKPCPGGCVLVADNLCTKCADAQRDEALEHVDELGDDEPIPFMPTAQAFQAVAQFRASQGPRLVREGSKP